MGSSSRTSTPACSSITRRWSASTAATSATARSITTTTGSTRRTCAFPSAVPCDNVFHGTHTMGTMVGDDQSGNQIGVAPSAKLDRGQGLRERLVLVRFAAERGPVGPGADGSERSEPAARPSPARREQLLGRRTGRPLLSGDGAGLGGGRDLPRVRQRQRGTELRQRRVSGRLPGVIRGRRLRHRQLHRVLLEPRALGPRRRDQAEHLRAGRRRAQQRPG